MNVFPELADMETSGQTASDGGQGRTTGEMQTSATFFDWGICGNEEIWTIDEGRDYPRLWWENMPGEVIEARLSDFLTGEGAQDSPYLIRTLEDLDTIARFPCEQDKHFRLMFVSGEGTQDDPYTPLTITNLPSSEISPPAANLQGSFATKVSTVCSFVDCAYEALYTLQ